MEIHIYPIKCGYQVTVKPDGETKPKCYLAADRRDLVRLLLKLAGAFPQAPNPSRRPDSHPRRPDL